MIPPKRVHPRSATVRGVADEGGVSASLWAKLKDDAAYAQYNPFVVALAAGTLKMESLLNYLGQDLYYLYKYAEACAMAEDCVDNDEDKELFKTKIQHTNNYIQEMEPWISAEESNPNVAAVDYTSFLLATAAGKVEGGKGPSGSWNAVETTKIPAYSICSMTPCSRLYRFLAQEFSKAVDFTNNRYTQWIEMIFGSGDSNSPLGTEQILDKLAKSLTEEERDSLLGRLYYHGLSFEIEFFSAVSLYQRTSVPLLKQGVKSNCRYTITLSCTVLDSSKVSTKNPIKSLPSKKANTFDEKGLNIFLKQQSKVIKSEGDLIIDINKARELKKMDLSNVEMHIVSVHWSGDIIKKAFCSSGLDFKCGNAYSFCSLEWRYHQESLLFKWLGFQMWKCI